MVKYVIKPHLPAGRVGSVVIGERYRARLAGALEALGVEALWLPDAHSVDPRLAGHADLRVLHLGGRRIVSACGGDTDGTLARLGFEVIPSPEPGESYPSDCVLNACIAGGKLFHRLDITAPAVLDNLDGLESVNIAQGYAKCCTCVVDERSVMTSDPGIARVCRACGLNVLEIRPGYIELEGFDYGFIGGASFKLSADELAFTGRLDAHPDFGAIMDFLAGRGVGATFLTGETAFDVGSVLPLTER